MNQTHIHMVSLAVCPPQTMLAVMVAVCFGFAFSLFLLYTLGKRFHKDRWCTDPTWATLVFVLKFYSSHPCIIHSSS